MMTTPPPSPVPDLDDSVPEGSRYRLVIVLAFLIFSFLSGWALERSEHYRLLEARTRASTTAQDHLRTVTQGINQALTASYALAALVRQGQGRIADFQSTAEQMLAYYPGVGALQLAPDGIIQQIVPFAGNEKALGHNLLKDRQRTKEAFLARDTGKLTLAGPFPLVQGGLGAVGRMPVFLTDANGYKKFWGFTAVLLRFPDVLDAAGLATLQDDGYNFELWRIHPDSGERQVIYRRGNGPLVQPLEHTLEVPNGQWTLSIEPINGWASTPERAIKFALATAFTLLATLFVALLLRQPLVLRREIALRTSELRAREAMLNSLNELATDWIWTQDSELRFNWFSAGMSRLLGCDSSALIGKYRWESATTLTAEGWAAHRAVLDARQSFRDFEYGVVFAADDIRYISTSGEPVFDRAGNFTGYRGTGKNITERKRAEQALQESEARFQSMFEESPVALSVTTDVDGFRATRWNRAWLQTFGYAAAVAQGKSGNDFGLWCDPATRTHYINSAIAHGGVSGIEAAMCCADGRIRQVCVSGRFVEAGGSRMLITYYDDVTEARANEKSIRELNLTLETRIAERTNELLLTNQRLSQTLADLQRTQADLLRSEKLAALGNLVAGVAHELNTPIGNGLLAITTLADQLDEFTTKQRDGLRRSDLQHFMEHVGNASTIAVRNLQRAVELIGSFKQVAVDQASAQRRQFDLLRVINEIIMTLRPTLKRTPYLIDIDVPAGIQLDSYPGALGQVLTNLINNAVIHGYRDRSAGTIHVSATTTADDRLRIDVRDDGWGMTDELQTRIFDPFFTTRWGSGGSGLGLHVAYNAVTRILGGSITVQSAPGAGSTFSMQIPRVAPQNQTDPGQADPA
jgi:PAS domain S-box-containing protein